MKFNKIDSEEGPLFFTIVENHFKNIKRLRSKNQPLVRRRPSIVPIVRRNSLIKDICFSNEFSKLGLADKGDSQYNYSHSRKSYIEPRKLSLQQSLNLPQSFLNTIKKSDYYLKMISEYEEEALKLEPKLEGRIICIDSPEVFILITIMLNQFKILNKSSIMYILLNA
jgi:hypothetical protein